jgi:predicted transcriptional regulator
MAKSKSNWIHFRTSNDLDGKLDAMAEQLSGVLVAQGIRPTRSTVARYLLEQAVGDNEKQAATTESLAVVQGMVQRVVHRALEDMRANLPKYLREAGVE